MHTIIIVDDHKIVREGVQRLLNKERSFQVIKTISSIHEMMMYVEYEQPDLILLDLKLQDGDGVSASVQLKKRYPLIKIILFSGFIEPDFAMEAERIGIEGYVLKTIELDKLIIAIKKVLGGERIYDPKVNDVLSKGSPDVLQRLSKQELSIIRLLALGKTNKEIAVQMGLAEKTARNYTSRLYKKIHVTSRTEAVAYYMRNRFKQDE